MTLATRDDSGKSSVQILVAVEGCGVVEAPGWNPSRWPRAMRWWFRRAWKRSRAPAVGGGVSAGLVPGKPLPEPETTNVRFDCLILSPCRSRRKSVAKNRNFYPVILAGGRGTRFWPLSRKKRAKQLLALDGKQTMIQQTVARLLPLAPAKNFWIITNDDLRPAIANQLPKLPKHADRGRAGGPQHRARHRTGGVHLARATDPDAVHRTVSLRSGDRRTRSVIARLLNAASRSRPPARTSWCWASSPPAPRPDTATSRRAARYQGDVAARAPLHAKSRMPDKAAEFVAAGNYFWNSGMFLWSARTLLNALREHLPKTAALLEEIAATYGTRKFAETFRKLYPKCENISVDYAMLEPRSAKGEQASQHLLHPRRFRLERSGLLDRAARASHREEQSTGRQSGRRSGIFLLNAHGNYLHAPGKFVAAVGVKDLVVVETDDALLITTRAACAGRGQDREVSGREEAAQA